MADLKKISKSEGLELESLFDACFSQEMAVLKYHRHDDIERAVKLCESPIERKLLIAMMFMSVPESENDHHCISVTKDLDFPETRAFFDAPDQGYTFAYPQAQMDGYRVDFLFGGKFYKQPYRHLFVVECDGHEFHERTKEQAAKDKKRDRDLMIGGLQVLRFTGSEIYRDPIGCAAEVSRLLFKLSGY